MSSALSLAGDGCILLGALVVLAASIGLVRMPDFFTRLHPAGVKDALGLPLLLIGVTLHTGFTLLSAKLVILLLFLWYTSPAAAHALGKAALLERKEKEGPSA